MSSSSSSSIRDVDYRLRGFRGRIDDVALYNSILSERAIRRRVAPTLAVEMTTTREGTFSPSVTSSNTHVWDIDDALHETNAPSVDFPDATAKDVRLYGAGDWSAATTLQISTESLQGRVRNLHLLTGLTRLYCNANNLNGPPPDLSSLSNLKYINAGANKFTGTLPNLSTWSDSLEYFNMNFNEVSGEIPTIPGNLKQFGVGWNDFTGRIPSLSGNVNLIELGIRATDVSGPIPDLSNNVNLVKLNINNNFLTGYSGGLDHCVSLDTASFQNNDLSTEALNDMVDDLYVIRATLGGNSCAISLEGNAGFPDADAVAKIEGTGAYAGDGLKDAGCSVSY